MIKQRETIKLIEALNENVKKLPADIEIERLNTFNFSAIVAMLGDIAQSLAIIADHLIEEDKDL